MVYKPPLMLRKRKDTTVGGVAMEADDATRGVDLHKDSRFSQSWQTFKDSNSGKQVPELKSEVRGIRQPIRKQSHASPSLTSFRMSFGAVFTNTELSETDRDCQDDLS